MSDPPRPHTPPPARYLRDGPPPIRSRYWTTITGALGGGAVGALIGALVGSASASDFGIIPGLFEMLFGALLGWYPGSFIGVGVALRLSRDPLATPTVRYALLTTAATFGLTLSLLRLQSRFPGVVRVAFPISSFGFLTSIPLARFLALRLHAPPRPSEAPLPLPRPGPSSATGQWGRVRIGEESVLPPPRYLAIWISAASASGAGAVIGAPVGAVISLFPGRQGRDLPMAFSALTAAVVFGAFLSWLAVGELLTRRQDPLATATGRAMVVAYAAMLLLALVVYVALLPDPPVVVGVTLAVTGWLVAPLAARWHVRHAHRRRLRSSLGG